MSDNQSELYTIKDIFTEYSNPEIHVSSKTTFFFLK